MKVEWRKTTTGTCSRCAGLRVDSTAVWERVFRSPKGDELAVRYCEAHAAAARRLVAA